MQENSSPLFKRIENEISTYLSQKVEISEGVFFSQYQLIKRLYKFRNRDLSGSKLNSDLSYDYYFDIISPRVDSEVKNLRFDTKNILVFSQNPRKDFPAVFISNAQLRSWMAENGEDEKLKSAVEEFSGNGNIGFKRVAGGYEKTDPLNTFITNQRAETIDDSDIIERHTMSASQLKRMSAWDQDIVDKVIKDLGNKSFRTTTQSTPSTTTSKKYEIYEFTGEVSEKEFNMAKGLGDEGDEHTYFLAKVIVAGLNDSGTGEKYTLFAEKLKGKLSDHYKYAHRGPYNGRFWRVGIYETLFDHQIRANDIGNQLARGLEWASKVVFRSRDSRILQNIRADIDNGDIIQTEDLAQVDVRLHNVDQLIADWNRLMADADRLTNSLEVVRGESLPGNTPFRMGALLNENAGKMFTFIRQKLTLPYRHVFREWVLPELVKDLKGQDIIRLVGEPDVLEQFREVLANSWYMENLVRIGPHTREVGEAIVQEKIEELKELDPVIKNTKEIWESVLPRMFVTITGENSDLQDQLQDLMSLLNLEQDPERRNWMLDTIYKARGIPVPPVRTPDPTAQEELMNSINPSADPSQNPELAGEQQPPVV